MKKSFTLIELIVVIAIIAILAAIIAPNAFKAIEKAKISHTIASAKALKAAIAGYYVDTGGYPPKVGPLAYVLDYNSLLQNDDGTGNPIPNWDGPYIEKWNDFHPWGGPWVIRSEEGFPEGTPGTNPHTGLKSGTVDIVLVLNNVGSTAGGSIPREAAQRIDDILDDGDLSDPEGNVYLSCAGNNCELRIWITSIANR
ncbi:MAG: type II secretion system protein GspG [Candidatus Omnitrophica bacterium]|nr:type II secretion system protein GspG [Candidatus Omnitrophota bacterium]MBU2473272.1 type II secretion system protein GspG [Candidatus Omnitrophota bacterium]